MREPKNIQEEDSDEENSENDQENDYEEEEEEIQDAETIAQKTNMKLKKLQSQFSEKSETEWQPDSEKNSTTGGSSSNSNFAGGVGVSRQARNSLQLLKMKYQPQTKIQFDILRLDKEIQTLKSMKSKLGGSERSRPQTALTQTSATHSESSSTCGTSKGKAPSEAIQNKQL